MIFLSSTNKSTTVSEFMFPVTSKLPPIVALPVTVKPKAPVDFNKLASTVLVALTLPAAMLLVVVMLPVRFSNEPV